jgi:oligopeptide transport system ATP-binding protein
MKKRILAIKDLEVKFLYNQKVVEALRSLTLDVFDGEMLALVGESNSGKSVLINTLSNLLNQNGWISGGEIIYTPPVAEEDPTKIEVESDIVEYHRSFLLSDTIRDVRKFYAHQIQTMANEIKLIETLNVDDTIQHEEVLSKKLDALRIKNETKKSNSLSYKINSIIYETRKWRHYVFLQNNLEERRKYLDLLIEKIELAKIQSEKIRELTFFDKLKLKKLMKIIERVKSKKDPWTEEEIFFFKKYFMKHELVNDIEERVREIGEMQQQNILVSDEDYKRLELKWDGVKKINILNRVNAQLGISQLRGSTIATVFKDSDKLLNPLFSIESQLADVIRRNKVVPRNQIENEVIRLLERVGLENAKQRKTSRPNKFNDVELQRICIAMAVASRPRILLCDEPVITLDAISRINLMNLISSLHKEMNMTVIITTHDIRNVVNYTDRIGVVYAGQIIEVGTTKEIITNPLHPYTWSILMSIPEINTTNDENYILHGDVPDLSVAIIGDAFAPRNKFALKIDWILEPPTYKISDTHYAKTWLLDYRSPKVERPKELKNVYKVFDLKEVGE